MALCNDQKLIERAARQIRRDRAFDSLHKAHARAWDVQFEKRHHYTLFHAWRMAWWYELAKAFPDKIKNGEAICTQANTRDRGAPSTYLSVSKSPKPDFPVLLPCLNGLYPEAIPYMQQSVIPGTFPEVMKSSGLICSHTSKPF